MDLPLWFSRLLDVHPADGPLAQRMAHVVFAHGGGRF